MASFHFRLTRVLEWYRKQCQLEENRLRLCAESVAQIKAEMERHRREDLSRQMAVLHAPRIDAFELAALGAFQRRARQLEAQMMQKCQRGEQAVDHQRRVVQAARRRLRLVEKLHERRFSEHSYELQKELEELASETHLAAFARALGSHME